MKLQTWTLAASTVAMLAIAACSNSTVAPGGGGNGGTGNVGQGGGTCDPYWDFPSPNTVTVTFHNDTSVPIYLPSKCSGPAYNVASVAGTPFDLNYDESCLQTCKDLQTEPQYDCGACAPTSYRIDVGDSLQVVWNGNGLEQGVQMPSVCWASTPGSGDTCPRIETAPAGQYTVTATAYNSCGANCACDAGGVCQGDPTGMSATSDTVSFAFPSTNHVEVTFASCAFGCPAGGG